METGREIRTAALVGLGGVGAFVAARLRDRLGPGFVVVAGGERRARLERGVVVNGVRERFQLRAPEEGTPADLVIFATKNMQLGQAMADAGRFVGEGTILLSLLNGIDSEDALAAAFPNAHVLRAFIKVPAVHMGEQIDLPLDKGTVFFGEDRNDPDALSPQAAAVEDLLRRAGVPFQVPADMVREQWLKYLCNVSENQVTAVLGLTYGDLQRSPHALELCRKVCREVLAVGQAEGVDLREEDVSVREGYLMALAPEGKTSTLQDVEAGRPTEVETFSGRVMALGRNHQIPTPVCEVLYDALKALEEKAGR